MKGVLTHLATAEETYFTDTAKYLPFIGPVPTALSSRAALPALPGVRLGVAVLSIPPGAPGAPTDAYCIAAFDTTVSKLEMYISSEGGYIPGRNSAISPEPCQRLVRTLKG